LGLVLQKQGKWEEAAESMKRAVELEGANEGWQNKYASLNIEWEKFLIKLNLLINEQPA
jgi:hypothetical protein